MGATATQFITIKWKTNEKRWNKYQYISIYLNEIQINSIRFSDFLSVSQCFSNILNDSQWISMKVNNYQYLSIISLLSRFSPWRWPCPCCEQTCFSRFTGWINAVWSVWSVFKLVLNSLFVWLCAGKCVSGGSTFTFTCFLVSLFSFGLIFTLSSISFLTLLVWFGGNLPSDEPRLPGAPKTLLPLPMLEDASATSGRMLGISWYDLICFLKIGEWSWNVFKMFWNVLNNLESSQLHPNTSKYNTYNTNQYHINTFLSFFIL